MVYRRSPGGLTRLLETPGACALFAVGWVEMPPEITIAMFRPSMMRPSRARERRLGGRTECHRQRGRFESGRYNCAKWRGCYFGSFRRRTFPSNPPMTSGMDTPISITTKSIGHILLS
jgi:hypothetical protein